MQNYFIEWRYEGKPYCGSFQAADEAEAVKVCKLVCLLPHLEEGMEVIAVTEEKL